MVGPKLMHNRLWGGISRRIAPGASQPQDAAGFESSPPLRPASALKKKARYLQSGNGQKK
jgi:hypothetical protein